MTSPPPNALCFGGDWPASGAPCHATAGPDGLTVEVLQPAARGFTLPYDRVSAEAGGFDHDHLVLKWDERDVSYTLYVKEAAVIQAVRAHARATLGSTLHRTAEAVRRHRSRRRTFLLTALGLVVGLLMALWIGADLLTEFAVARVPISWEDALGESAFRQYVAGQTVLTEGPAVEAVQAITARLSGALTDSPYRFHVAVVDSGVVNAFALPGGYVVVFTGLLKKAASAEEVAGVLGHEFIHVLKRHAVGRLVKTVGLVAVVAILTGNQQGWVGLVKELGIEMATLKFGRGQETEADVEGLRLLHRARVAPEGMVTFFERLAEQGGQQIEILSSHPVSEGRAERLKAEIARLPHTDPEPFTTDWAQIQKALSK